MKLRTLFIFVTLAVVLMLSAGLPVEKELLRVKRKGEMDDGDEGRRRRRDLSTQTTKSRRSLDEELVREMERELRRKRRFQAETSSQIQGESDEYMTKMEARSSRSAREDKDVTERGLARFTGTPTDTKGEKQPAKRSTSGPEDEAGASASGMWISESATAQLLSSKSDKKRSLNSLESIVAALSAINDISPEGDADAGSTSGAWDISGSQSDLEQKDDKGRFFTPPASQSHIAETDTSGSASGSDTDLASDLEEEAAKLESTVPEEEPAKKHGDSSIDIKRRATLEDYLGVPDVPDRRRRHDDIKAQVAPRHDEVIKHKVVDPKDQLARFYRSIQADIAATEQAASTIINSNRLGSSVEGAETEGGFSLVKRFYRDQEMRQSGEAVQEAPRPSTEVLTKGTVPVDHDDAGITTISTSPLDTAAVTKATKVPDSSKVTSDIFESRVVRKKQIPKAHVTIFEEPAVYSPNDEKGMDSSDGGMNGEDWEEPAIEMHVRDIREDGYVGCYMDQTPDRDLPYPVSVTDLTPTACRAACKDKRHAYAGLQYGYLCKCGDSYGKYSKLEEGQCSTRCKGDETKICGGFYRNSIYATEGVTEPTHGDFFHIESVQPIDTVPYNSQAYNYPPPPNVQPAVNFTPQTAPLALSGPAVQMPQPVQAPAYFAPEDPGMIIHSETPLPMANQAPVNAEVKTQVHSAPIPDVMGDVARVKMSTIAKPPKPQTNVAIQTVYLHRQDNIGLKPKTQKLQAPHIDVELGTKTYTGSIKLKQSWLDNFQNKDSPEYKILSGNLEQALKKMFATNAYFIKASALGFREGLIKNNPSTVRKVIAPFTLTFKEGIKGVEDVFKKSVMDSGKLFDMPVYKQSVQINEYHAQSAGKQIQDSKQGRKDKQRRSGVAEPKLPYTLEFFLMKDLGKKKRADAQMA